MQLCAIVALIIAASLAAMPSYADTPLTSAEAPGANADHNGLEQLEEELPAWLRYDIAGFRIWQLAGAFVLILFGMVAKKVSDHFFDTRLIPLFTKTRFQFDKLLTTAASKPLGVLWLLLGFGGAFTILDLPSEPNLRGVAYGALKVALAANALWFLFRLVDVATLYLKGLASRTESQLDDQLVPLLRKALKATIAVIVSIWTIQLLGYSASSLLAGLGIGGLAVALGLQDTLADFFGAVFIFLDRPFNVGDRIIVGGVDGFVEEIGFRSTRIRTLEKSYVTVPNKILANDKIDNWSRLTHRRVFQTVGVTYETTSEQMSEAVARIQCILDNDPGVDKGYYLVRFEGFGDSSLNIWLYYFTPPDWGLHLEIKQRINLAIMGALSDMGLSIAFPTRTLYLEGDIAKTLAGHGLPPGTQAETLTDELPPGERPSERLLPPGDDPPMA